MSEFVAAKNTGADSRRSSAGRMSPVRPVPPQVLEIIEHFLHTAQNGFVILSIQDGHVVKVEKTEKFIITAKSRDGGYINFAKPLTKHPLQAKIVSELQAIQYGQLIIRLDNGQVEHIEKTEKRRVNELEGIYGDGI